MLLILQRSKRKSDEIISETRKEQCFLPNPTINNGHCSSSIEPVDSQLELDIHANDFEFGAVPTASAIVSDFDLAAVKPVKKVFVPRLPPNISHDVLKRQNAYLAV